MIRVRFAPSPTGEAHLGNARTAIINYIFAKQNNGVFLLRIEDTDIARSSKEYENAMIDILNWLHITWNEKPLVQSQRFDIYRQAAQKLYEQGYAYYCTCPAESDMKQCTCKNHNHQQGVLRFKVMPENTIEFTDLVYGPIATKTDVIEDFALIRSDGTPTYMLCVVIDDIESQITHIIRGEDHRSNTPKQILIYNALNAQIPQFAHLPMIIGEDGKKLSKRNGGASIEHFRSLGIDYRGMMNYLMRLGWGYENKEYFTIEELLQLFDIKRVKRSQAKFDVTKMLSCSKFFICKSTLQDFEHYCERYKSPMKIPQYLYENICQRYATYAEIYDALLFVHEQPKIFERQVNKKIIQQIIDIMMHCTDCHEIIMELKNKKLHNELRMVMTGKSIGGDLALSLQAVGVCNMISRLKQII